MPAPTPRPPRPPLRAQLALVFWLTTGAVLALEDHAPFDRVARNIAPFRRGLGISQSWSMFAPNPSRSTSWLEVEGRAGAQWHRLTPSSSAMPTNTDWKLRYERTGKFFRGLLSQAATRDRKAMAAWWCRERPELATVRFLQVRVPSSPPGVAPATGPQRRTPVEVVSCRSRR